jgi:hypothetical protein
MIKDYRRVGNVSGGVFYKIHHGSVVAVQLMFYILTCCMFRPFDYVFVRLMMAHEKAETRSAGKSNKIL